MGLNTNLIYLNSQNIHFRRMKKCAPLMVNNLGVVFVLFLSSFVLSLVSAVEVYTNHFHVHTHKPGAEHAHQIAKRHGFVNRGAVSHFKLYLIYQS